MVAQISRWRGWPVVAALFVLNASLTFENVWPTPWITWGHAFSLELAACVLLLAVVHRQASGLSRRILPILWVALVVGHYLDVTAPGLYGREFNLYWDAQHLGNVAAMLARDVPWWLIAGGAIGLAAAIGSMYLTGRWAIGQLARAMQDRRPRIALAGIAGAFILLFAGQQLVSSLRFVAFANPVTPSYLRQARFVLATIGPGATAPRLAQSPRFDSSLGGLGGIDVLLIFVESYGAISYETPAISAALNASRAEFDAAISDTGRQVVSAYVESPTFGGSSWLAHLSLLSGVEVRDQYAYTALMASKRDTIVTNFATRGYHTIALMPGMRQAWPEGAFYGFDVIYGRDRLAYTGPQFGWWSIPDQYALARLDAVERPRAPRQPVFVVFPTSTTHAPFGPVPPYQPKWSRVLTTDAFDRIEVARAMAVSPDLSNLRPSYARAMAYEYRSLAGYLREQAGDVLLIVIGDHQPPAAVSGRDARWDVPVHVIGRRQRILDRLRGHGFGSGLDPRRPTIGRMSELTPMLLDAFDAPAAPSQAVVTISGSGSYLDKLNGNRVPAPTARARRPPRIGKP